MKFETFILLFVLLESSEIATHINDLVLKLKAMFDGQICMYQE